MKALITISLIIICLCSCKNEERIRIYEFDLYKHNLNWINDTSQLLIKQVISFDDSINVFHCSNYNRNTNKTDYYNISINQDIRSLLINNFYQKTYSDCLIGKPSMYDGYFYTLIYKIGNERTNIINFIPHALPDSLKRIIMTLDKLAKDSSRTMIPPFEMTSKLMKFKDTIVKCLPLPPPTLIETDVKFKQPN